VVALRRILAALRNGRRRLGQQDFQRRYCRPFNVGSIATGDVNRTDTVWVAGGGVESAPWHNGLLLRAEYLYYAFNGASFIAPCTRCVPGAFDGPGVFTWSNSHFQVARVGISYKWGVGPIVAKD
jgi:opacity protein-like surface antigen